MDVDLSDLEDDYEEVSFQDLFGAALADGSTTIAIQEEMVAKVKRESSMQSRAPDEGPIEKIWPGIG
jgi:hypothetical protein